MNIGTRTDGGGSVKINLPRLVESRMVLTANSGAGKSWALRRILEQTHGQVQQIVVDVEDEFYTLREKYDYVLAGRTGGECPADLRSAEMLARRLLELQASAIISIYELQAHERIRFVRLFLEALLVAAGKSRNPALVVIDECQLFCPERGQGEAESGAAVIDLMSRGRKRGLCGVLASQRVSRIRKDAIAEANNKLFGRSSLDVDMKRVADELGFYTKDAQTKLRTLTPGAFFAFGPALSDTVVEVMVGPVVTTHPKVGQRIAPPPPPREKVLSVLAKLADLPREAEEEAKSVKDLQAQVHTLRRELTIAKRQPLVAADPNELKHEYDRGVAATKKAASLELARYEKESTAHAKRVAVAVERSTSALGEAILAIQSFKRPEMTTLDIPAAEPEPPPRNFFLNESHTTHIPKREVKFTAPSNSDLDLSGPARKILTALAEMLALGVEDVPRQYAMFMSGYTNLTSTGFVKAMSRLSSSKLTSYPSAGSVALTEEGRAHAPDVDQPSTGAELRSRFMSLLGGKKSDMLRVLIAEYPRPVAREDLMRATGYGNLTSTGFVKAVSQLSSLGLLSYPSKGSVRAGDLLFLPHERK